MSSYTKKNDVRGAAGSSVALAVTRWAISGKIEIENAKDQERPRCEAFGGSF